MIETALFDIDGILTDGTVTIDSSGSETKRICFDDIDAVFELKRAGVKIGFLTGESNNFTKYVRERFLPDFFIDGCKDKLSGFNSLVREFNLDVSKTAYVGDSKKDVDLLNHVPFSFAPSDALPAAQKVAKVVLRSRRGEGVVREFVDFFFGRDVNVLRRFDSKKEASRLNWQAKIKEHLDVISALYSDKELLSKVETVAGMIIEAYRSGHKLLICGNGGSAADAQHLAAELVGRFTLERSALDAEAITANVSSMTALGNDYTYDIIFSRQIESKGKKGDILLGISTSGRSKNVIVAVETARRLGMVTIGITCSKKDVELARTADVCLNMPSNDTARVQETYMLIGHLICEAVESTLFGR